MHNMYTMTENNQHPSSSLVISQGTYLFLGSENAENLKFYALYNTSSLRTFKHGVNLC